MGEREIKKRKIVFFFPFSSDIIIEITKFIKKLKDYLNLARINKTMYDLMMKDNLISLNDIFKRNVINFKDNLNILNIPNYFFQLNFLNIENILNGFTLLENFTQLKCLKVKKSEINDDDLKNLTNLEKLKIHCCNNLTGSCFNNFKKLEKLNIFECLNIKDENFMNLYNLKKLNSDNTNCLQYLQQLTSLKLFSETVKTDNLNLLVNLKKLYFYTETDNFNFLNCLTNLEVLDILVNDNLIDNHLIHLKNLKYLNLTGDCYLKGDCLMHLNKLEHFSCNISENEEEQLMEKFNEENLKYLKNLKTLNFQCKKISGDCLSDLEYLKELTINCNQHFKEGYLQNLINLEYLVILNNETFKGKYLNNLQNLTQLKLPRTKVKDKYLFNLTKLKYLNLKKCKKITGECFVNLKHLEELNINKTKISEIYLMNLTNLKKLKIRKCFKIIYGKFLLNMNNLQHLFYSFKHYKKEQITKLKSSIKEGNLLCLEIENYNEDNKFIYNIIQEMNKYLLKEEQFNIEKYKLIINEKDRLIEKQNNEIKKLQYVINNVNNH